MTKVCSPYTITESIYVDGNGVLTIEPGVTLNFTANNGLNVGQASTAQLVAVGTAQNPILFTSASSTPAAGDWAGIHFWVYTMAGSKIAYAGVDYCGSNHDGCIVGSGVNPNLVTVDHITIDHVGIGSDGILENDPASNFVITNSSFDHIPAGNYAISVQAPSFAGIGAGSTFNYGAMIELAGGTVPATTSWVDPGTAIVVTHDLSVDGAGNPALTLGPGMTFKFGDGVGLDVGQLTGGKLVVAGLAYLHVTLTSATEPASPGHWGGVKVWDSGQAQITYADFDYGGNGLGDSHANLNLESTASTAKLTVANSTFKDGLGWGIWALCATSGQSAASLTVDSATTYSNDALGNKGPSGAGCP